jgi:exosortase
MIPLPPVALDATIAILQKASTEVVYVIYTVIDVPFIREGFTFHLPSLSFVVAPQCSGIRSSLALFIISLPAGHFFLRQTSNKLLLCCAVFPITVFKNGVRIVVLTLFGAYVNEEVLTSALHNRGGIPFMVIALLLVLTVLMILRRVEAKRSAQ